jgi:hypothetical protein
MLVIAFPDRCRSQHHWICMVLLDEFLGLQYEVSFDGGDDVRICAAGKTLTLPEKFFAGANEKWLSAESLPAEPLQNWMVQHSGLTAQLVEPTVPVLFGEAGFEVRDVEHALLKLDVFGSAFFMLTRYEEAASTVCDEHGRFPAAASLSHRQGFISRPLVDEYVEILWAAMTHLWPQLIRKPRQFRMLVSCDVDHPYHPSAASLFRLIRRTTGEAMRKRTLTDTVVPLRNYIASRQGNWENDPYYFMVDWMMEVNERAGNMVAFYFIPEITDPVRDGRCSLDDTAVRAMLRRVYLRGHEIGLHPGYNSYRSAKDIISGKSTLQQVLDSEGLRQDVSGGRQHYLRWSTRTPGIWDEAQLQYDSTLGYPDRAGFRSGTCHEYPMFDLHHRRPLKLRQRPLICMECSVIAYMGHGFTASALDAMTSLKNAVRKVNGNFSLSWHNSYLESPEARNIYREIIS